MAPNIDEYLVFLKENASEIKSLGKQWGMNEDDIVSCVNEVLSKSPNLEKKGNTPLNLARKAWRIFLFLLKLSCYAILVLIALMTAFSVAMQYGPAAEYVSKTISSHTYKILRMFRLTALPLHNVANMTTFYDVECIVDNPWFVEPEDRPDCTPCSIFKKIREAEADNFTAHKFGAYIRVAKPVLLKKTYDRNVTYSDLRKAYQGNKIGIEQDLQEFTSTDPEVPSLQVLFDEDKEHYLNSSEALQISWKFYALQTEGAFNELFPRPSYMPEKKEVLTENVILIDSPKTGTYQLPQMSSPYILYTQAHGRRRILLKPIEACKDKCSALLVIIEPGDSLAYDDNLYDLFFSANGDALSIGYVSLVIL